MVKALLCLFGSLFAVSCSQRADVMEVDVLKLSNTELAGRDSGMVRADQNYLFFGEVSKEGKRSKLGQYYTVKRANSTAPAKLRFFYQQAKTQSKVLRREGSMAAGQTRFAFNITGDDYLANGRVLAWKIELIEGGKVKATKQSYMWK